MVTLAHGGVFILWRMMLAEQAMAFPKEDATRPSDKKG
jgi:hypothetical protein